MPALNEAETIARVRNGDASAFAKIVEHYQIPIIRYLYRMTGDYGVAQDLAQDTFVNAYKALLKSDSELAFRPWLYRIATNNARQYHRRNRFLSFVPFSRFHADTITSHRNSADELELNVVVQDILLRIPPDHRQCLVLHLIEGLTYREIANVLGLSEDAVRMRVARGKQSFRREYERHSGGEAR